MTETTEFINKVVASFKNIFETEDAEEVKAKPQTTYNATMITGNYSYKLAERRNELHPYLSCVKPNASFKIKTDHGNIIGEASTLGELCNQLKTAPDEAIIFHMRRGNDFAAWVKGAVGDWYLGTKIEKINFQNPAVARSEIVRLLEERITKLQNH